MQASVVIIAGNAVPSFLECFVFFWLLGTIILCLWIFSVVVNLVTVIQVGLQYEACWFS